MSEITWYIGEKGAPTHAYLPGDIETFTQPYPKSLWYMGGSAWKPRHAYLPENIPALEEPLPMSLWRIDVTVNDGKPFHKYLPGMKSLNIWSLPRESVIRVYDISEPQGGFDHNGLAILCPESCTSLHNDDVWDINMAHPLDNWGKWKHLRVQNVLKIDGQLFRIDMQENGENEEGGYIKIHASHITSDLADRLIEDAVFPGGNAQNFLNFAEAQCFESWTGTYYKPYEFDISSDITDVKGETSFTNVTLWSAIVSADNSCISRYGGELYRDNFYVSVNKRMENARDDGFNLRYTRDMTEIKQIIDYRDFYTYLYARDNFGNGISGSYMPSANWAIHHTKKKMCVFNYSDEATAMEQLSADYDAMWEQISKPKVSYEVRLAALKNDPRYADFAVLQDLRYGDRGRISCPELDISTEQQIIEVERDEVNGDILGMRLGNLTSSIIRPGFRSSTLSSGHSVEDKANAAMQTALKDAELRSLRTWDDASAYSWGEIKKFTWEEVKEYAR